MVINNKDSVPEGLWIISSFWFIGVLVSLILGGLGLTLFDTFRGTAGYPIIDPATMEIAGYVTPIQLFGLGILFISLAVVSYFVARGLLKANNWARFIVGMLSLLGAIFAIIKIVNLGFAMGTFSLLLYGLIVWYLFFNKSVNKFFKK